MSDDARSSADMGGGLGATAATGVHHEKKYDVQLRTHDTGRIQRRGEVKNTREKGPQKGGGQ